MVVEFQSADDAGVAIRRDMVRIQCHGAVAGQCPAIHNGGAGIERDARQRKDTAFELGRGVQRRGAADLPVYVAAIRAIDQTDERIGGGYERGADLEVEAGIRIALSIKS